MCSKSRTNRRPPLPISSLSSLDVLLPAQGNAWVVCPDCGYWAEVKRGLVRTHYPDGARCDGSAQVIDFDLSWVEQDAAEQRAAASALLTELRTATRQQLIKAGRTQTHHPGKTLPEGRRNKARRNAAQDAQHRDEQHLREAAATTMAAEWSGLARVPEAPAVSQIAAQRATRHANAQVADDRSSPTGRRPLFPGAQVAGYGQTELWLSPAEIGRANMAPRPQRRALTSPTTA